MTEQEEFEFRLRLEKERGTKAAPKDAPTPPPSKARTVASHMDPRGPFEAALSLGTGMVATPLAGIAGLAQGALNRLGMGETEAGDRVRQVQEDLTYRPRSKSGEVITEAVSYPFEKLAQGADAVGQAVTDVAGPEAGTAANVSLQAIPMIAGGVVAGRGGRAQPQASPPVLPASTKPSLPAPAIERASRGEGLDVPVRYTKGQATRDPEQLRREVNLAETTQGRDIRVRHEEQNKALIANLDVLKGNTGAKAVDLEGVGKKVAGEGSKTEAPGAITMAERKSNDNVGRLYARARRMGELEQTVDVTPITQAIRENPNASSIFNAQMKAMGIEDGKPVTLDQLERARKRAVLVSRTSNDGTLRFDAGQLIKAIDEGVPESVAGDAYKAARAARKGHAMQFEEPRAISKLIGEKTRTDREVALENVWAQTVKKGSIADLERVRTQLLRSPDRATRDAGRKAWREIVGQTVEHIKAEATKSVAPDASGNAVLNPGALKSAVDAIGPRKLDLILGPSAAQKVKNIVQTAQDVKTLPPFRGGSTTVPNSLSVLFNVLDKVIKHVPVGSDFARGLVVKAKGIKDEGAAARAAQDALRNPLGEAQPAGTNPVSLADLAARSRVSPTVPAVGGLIRRE